MFVHREHELVVENNIVGFQFKIIKSPCLEDSGETARLDLQMEFSEIHVLFKLLLFWKLAVINFYIVMLLDCFLNRFWCDVSYLERLALPFWRY